MKLKDKKINNKGFKWSAKHFTTCIRPVSHGIHTTVFYFLIKLFVKIRFVWLKFFEFFFSFETNPLISRQYLDNLPLS